MANSGGFGAFSLLPAIDGSVVNPGVDNQGRAVRQRRHHTKSRQGCTNCKSRKIKVCSYQICSRRISFLSYHSRSPVPIPAVVPFSISFISTHVANVL
ncbi:hypothetical protein HD806DRAFT_59082 [Xylariaceae sp. AK1471]|nr:hypothetical protein HD806DRAFT_59082 [Xylariaceae sp. AK1471]